MRFARSILGKLVEPINRRRFQTIVDRHDGDAYDKAFRSWDHLMTLIYAQFSGASSLHSLGAGWNTNRQHHCHLGSGRLSRSTVSDANRRRPAAASPRRSPAYRPTRPAVAPRRRRHAAADRLHAHPAWQAVRLATSNGRIRA
jgi:Domain of unknown function (DUF4372)